MLAGPGWDGRDLGDYDMIADCGVFRLKGHCPQDRFVAQTASNA